MDLYNSGNRSIYLMSCIVELLKAENISDAPENIENKEKIVFALQVCMIHRLYNLYNYVK